MTNRNPLTEAVTRALQVPGITKAGGAWLAKALHPSDATLKCSGVPEDTSLPTAALNFMTTQTISAPAAATWGADVVLAPSPTVFGRTATETAAAYGYTSATNPTLTANPAAEFGALGKGFSDLLVAGFCSNALRYRLMYASVTVSLTASATSNEGSVVAAQYDAQPIQTYSVPGFDATQNPVGTWFSRTNQAWYNSPHSTAALQSMPGAVSWDAKKGVYLVLKLDEDAMNWHSAYETYVPLSCDTSPAVMVPGITAAFGNFTDHATAGAAAAVQPPWGIHGTWGLPAASGTGATSAIEAGTIAAVYPPTCGNVGTIRFTGLNASASLILTWRVGYEVIASPLSPYVTFMSAPVPADPIAIAAYHAISREMLAAYPAEYNIFGALFNVIKSIGS